MTTVDGVERLPREAESHAAAWQGTRRPAGRRRHARPGGGRDDGRAGRRGGRPVTARPGQRRGQRAAHGAGRDREVRWHFSGGTIIRQRFQDQPTMQRIAVDVTASWVVVEVVATLPGDPDHDYAPISDVSVVGTS